MLCILHVFICFPQKWLAGNTADLDEFDFGVADMVWTVDMLDNTMGNVKDDGSLFLDVDFVMNIFLELFEDSCSGFNRP